MAYTLHKQHTWMGASSLALNAASSSAVLLCGESRMDERLPPCNTLLPKLYPYLVSLFFDLAQKLAQCKFLFLLKVDVLYR